MCKGVYFSSTNTLFLLHPSSIAFNISLPSGSVPTGFPFKSSETNVVFTLNISANSLAPFVVILLFSKLKCVIKGSFLKNSEQIEAPSSLMSAETKPNFDIFNILA
eukprot:Pompholyxophrys_punicea_v1_NODE_183_length_2949_cov_1.855218.p3 type:complete len:106 gc:universal NODE_183_length_2949_cov_1.855218:2042-2359(+)